MSMDGSATWSGRFGVSSGELANRGLRRENQGIERAKGRYVLLLNSDTLVLDGAIAQMVSFSEAHPEARPPRAGC
jgi:hypothetical protein